MCPIMSHYFAHVLDLKGTPFLMCRSDVRIKPEVHLFIHSENTSTSHSSWILTLAPQIMSPSYWQETHFKINPVTFKSCADNSQSKMLQLKKSLILNYMPKRGLILPSCIFVAGLWWTSSKLSDTNAIGSLLVSFLLSHPVPLKIVLKS